MTRPRLIVATGNAHKLYEMRQVLQNYFEVVGLKDIGFQGDLREDGDTFEANAEQKARQIFEREGGYVLADDSGLCVDALGGAPGVYSARYAGLPSNDEANNDKLLSEMMNIPESDRGAKFVCVLCLIKPDGSTQFARGEIAGTVLTRRIGSGGFGYDPLFQIPALGITMAELSDEEKQSISHRANALAELGRTLGLSHDQAAARGKFSGNECG